MRRGPTDPSSQGGAASEGVAEPGAVIVEARIGRVGAEPVALSPEYMLAVREMVERECHVPVLVEAVAARSADMEQKWAPKPRMAGRRIDLIAVVIGAIHEHLGKEAVRQREAP